MADALQELIQSKEHSPIRNLQKVANKVQVTPGIIYKFCCIDAAIPITLDHLLNAFLIASTHFFHSRASMICFSFSSAKVVPSDFRGQGHASFEKKISIPPAGRLVFFFQKPCPRVRLHYPAHETKQSILRLFRRIKKMSEMKNNSIGNGNRVKRNSTSSHCRISHKIQIKIQSRKTQKS